MCSMFRKKKRSKTKNYHFWRFTGRERFHAPYSPNIRFQPRAKLERNHYHDESKCGIDTQQSHKCSLNVLSQQPSDGGPPAAHALADRPRLRPLLAPNPTHTEPDRPNPTLCFLWEDIRIPRRVSWRSRSLQRSILADELWQRKID